MSGYGGSILEQRLEGPTDDLENREIRYDTYLSLNSIQYHGGWWFPLVRRRNNLAKRANSRDSEY